MINVLKLVKGDEAVFVNDDRSDIQYKYWVEQGFVVEGEMAPEPTPIGDTGEGNKTPGVENDETITVLDKDELLVLPKADLIALAAAKGIEVDENQPKDKIVELIVLQS